MLESHPRAVCRGIDLDASQVGRYNTEARKRLDGDIAAVSKMLAIQGDLTAPSEELSGSEWRDFDMAIISMALHHVRDPVEMLQRLRERIRPGGTLVVVEFLGREIEADKEDSEYDADNMVEVHGNQKIWPGFTTGRLEGNLSKAGFEGFDARVLEEPARIPASARAADDKVEEKWCFFAKAMVPGQA